MNYLIARNLFSDEVACPCCGKNALTVDTLMAWERLRSKIGVPITVRSGVRCEAHNKAVGGKAHSFHLIGRALDLWWDGYDPESTDLLKLLYQCGYNGIGRHAVFVHVDIRPEPSFWRYDPTGILLCDYEADRIFCAWKRGV